MGFRLDHTWPLARWDHLPQSCERTPPIDGVLVAGRGPYNASTIRVDCGRLPGEYGSDVESIMFTSCCGLTHPFRQRCPSHGFLASTHDLHEWRRRVGELVALVALAPTRNLVVRALLRVAQV